VNRSIQLLPLPDFPLVEPGDDWIRYILQSLHRAKIALVDGDLLVVAQKIVSKAENRFAYLNEVVPGAEALALAGSIHKDPRLVELILSESVEVLRRRQGVMIVEHRLGYVHANAGIDQSNVASDPANPRVLLLPKDPDQSAAMLRSRLKSETGADIAVIINDTSGRAWRNGVVGFAIGTAGFEPLVNLIGQPDLYGRRLEATQVAVADELAAAASFLMGQADDSVPVVLVRGARLRRSESGSRTLIRARNEDLFR
jgi:coenzyme F420-0:L-glutamate ligase/coenzyme F420-1:gamma-L-glutamate ligase